jgi:hypothetical protein
MATSILRVNEHHATFNDVDLLLVLRMFLSSMKNADKEKLSDIATTWERAIETNAPGVVDLPVEEYANNADTRTHLVSLLTAFEASLSDQGDEVPLAHLKQECRIPGVVFERPYPIHRLLDAVRQLRDLIGRGE